MATHCRPVCASLSVTAQLSPPPNRLAQLGRLFLLGPPSSKPGFRRRLPAACADWPTIATSKLAVKIKAHCRPWAAWTHREGNIPRFSIIALSFLLAAKDRERNY